MDKKAREQSVKNAFEVIRPKLIEGKAILLVDDIFTSGATVSNCAKSLKRPEQNESRYSRSPERNRSRNPITAHHVKVSARPETIHS
jgi:hypoxanthine phosphoribosyltransferase